MENQETTPLLPQSHIPRWYENISWIRRTIALLIFAVTLWAVLISIFKEDVLPNSQLFHLAVLCIAAYIAGWLVSLITLPPLLGMLLTGVLLRNIGFINFTENFVPLQARLRSIALVIILVRAGLGLDADALKRLKFLLFRLAVCPSITEIVTTALVSHFLFDLPWVWSFLLGSVLAAVSPAVVIPCLFSLQARGYGNNKSIPTLIIAAACFDDIIGVAAFRIILSIIFSTGDLTQKILEGPISILIGFLFGIIWGFLLYFIPGNDDKYVVPLRCLLMAVGGLLCMFGSDFIHFDGAGPLGCVVAAFVAAQCWRKLGWTSKPTPVSSQFALLWEFFQPILFGLIGTEIDLRNLNGHTVALSIACILIGLMIRLIITVLIASGGNLTRKEKLFVAIAWFPKATVQAAIGPVALDMALQSHHEDYIPYGQVVLVVAVLSILLTAPLGAILVTITGPRFLTHDSVVEEERRIIQEGRESIVVNVG